MTIKFTKKEISRHDILNILSRNQAMVYLGQKSLSEAIKDSHAVIEAALKSDSISKDIYLDLLKTVKDIFIQEELR